MSKIHDDLRKKLFTMGDEKNMKFTSNIIPGAKNIIGLKTPDVRNIVKDILKGDVQEFLKNPYNDYYEEVIIEAMLIAQLKCTIELKLEMVKNFVPKIDNWAVCDVFCCDLKCAKKNQKEFFDFVLPYLESNEEFKIRFAMIIMLAHFVNDEYIDKILPYIFSIKHDGYYARMGAAWAISVCYVKFPQKTLPFIKNNKLDNFTHNKGISKIRESFRASKEDKEMLNAYKRKN